MANYVLVPEARNDLLGIFNYIANDSVEAALRVHRRFLEVFEFLAENPDVGHYRDDLTTRPIRFSLSIRIWLYTWLIRARFKLFVFLVAHKTLKES